MAEITWDVEAAPEPSPGSSAQTGPVTTVLTFRDSIREKTPSWLRRGVAEKVLYAIGIQFDGLAEALVSSIKMRFPGLYSAESLPLHGRERRIRRGRTESNEVYATRLRRWLDDHRTRGGPYALLAQVHAHFAPGNFPVDLVYYSGRRFQLDVAGDVTYDDIDWTFDADSARWPRWWLFYHWPTLIPDDGVWGDPGTWGDGGMWGSSLTGQEVTDLRLVPREWNAAHARGWIVLLTEGELWGYPEGTWGDPGVWGGAGPVVLAVGERN